jgi:DNA invertase Pin-like site-specific DNA recombinase
MKAVGYIRVSKVGGREGDSFLSPSLQREQIETVAAREGLDVVEVVEELDASGGDAKRPGWNRAIEMVESGEVGALVVWNLSRFSRSTRDFLNAWERIEDAGGHVFSATEQLDNKMVRTILVAVGEAERDRARDGWAAATQNAMERGVFIGARIPFGYVRDADRRLVPDPATAPVLRRMFEMRASGESWGKIVKWAEAQGHAFSTSGVTGMLRNPTYLGQVRQGDRVVEDTHEALVSKALFKKAAFRGQRRSSRDGYLTEKFLLAGVATCAGCGRYMRLSAGNGGAGKVNIFYRCRNRHCTEKSHATAGTLDAHVLNVIEATENPADPSQWVARPGGDDAELTEAESALEDARADLDGYLADTTLRRSLGAERYNAAVSDYVAVVNKAEADLAAAREASSGSFDLVGRLWLTEWGWAERKEWLEKMVTSVVVHRGRGPMSGRVEVELR